MTRRVLITIIVLLVSGGLDCATRPLMAASYQEHEVEAAFVYNFAKFVEWPDEAFEASDSPIVIGIVGDNPISSTLAQIVEGKQLNGRRFVIRQMKWNDDLQNRQIVFIAGSESARAAHLIDRLKGSPVLTIGETAGLARQGAVIGFVVDQGKVRFEINLDAARRAHLTISSRLLSLAKSITGSREGRG